VYDEVAEADLPGRLASFGPRYRVVVGATPDHVMRATSDPQVWSALAYCCHVRDVLLGQRERFYLALVEDQPKFWPMYRELRPGLAGYDAEDPVRVLDQLEIAAQLIADSFAAVEPSMLQRTGIYGYPQPTPRTLVWLGQHTVHEGEHHLGDVADALRAVKDGR
jgi:S-DNA-T family DNA segregation ATPase FtsK/SpoIIIE